MAADLQEQTQKAASTVQDKMDSATLSTIDHYGNQITQKAQGYGTQITQKAQGMLETAQGLLDSVFPPEKRAAMLDKVKAFGSANPKLAVNLPSPPLLKPSNY